MNMEQVETVCQLPFTTTLTFSTEHYQEQLINQSAYPQPIKKTNEKGNVSKSELGRVCIDNIANFVHLYTLKVKND